MLLGPQALSNSLGGVGYFQSSIGLAHTDRMRSRRTAVERQLVQGKCKPSGAGRLRRYAVGNRLNRFGTLTYAVACTDPKQVSRDVGVFFRDLRQEIGRPFPYVWVREWHPGGHGLHVHFLVGRFIRQRLIRGFGAEASSTSGPGEQVRLGEGAAAEARNAARYMAKYVRKAADEDRIPGLHRYEVAQDFQPKAVCLRSSSESRR